MLLSRGDGKRYIMSPTHRQHTSQPVPPVSLQNQTEIEEFLRTPSWDISDLLSSKPKNGGPVEQQVTTKEVHHLLRLSALRIEDEEKTEAQRRTLEAQLDFVKAVQSVDTTDVEPLVAIRDETAAAREEAEITVDSLQAVFDREEQVGRYKRIVTKSDSKQNEGAENGASPAEKLDWDPLSQAASKIGRYIKVNTKQS